MKRIIGLLAVLMLLLSFSTVSWGAGIFGETDLMVAPTTTTLTPGNMALSLNFIENDLTTFNFDFGLANDLEAGVAAYHYPDVTKATLRGKFRLLRETREQPSLSIGIQDIGEDEISPYLVVGKTFTETGIHGYLGAGGGAIEGIFGGLSKTFKTSSGSQLQAIQLFVEADSKDVNAGARFKLKAPLTLNFGFIEMDRWVIGGTVNLH